MNVETSSRVAGITNSGTDKSAERAQSSVTFVGGTLLVEGPASEELVRASNRNQLSKRDTLHNDVGLLRVPAYWFGDIASRADQRGHTLRGDLREAWGVAPASWEHLQLRAYQEEALSAWLVDRRGVIAMPTGAGKTKVAVAALLACGVPSVILCPTRALLAHWSSELSTTIREHIGVVGDGQRRLERVTVMTFESAYRHLDEIGDRFGLLVVDEVHHFASGARAEALEVCAAPYRLGLSATAPPSGSQGAARLDDLIGPVVMEISIAELVGKHLAPASILTIPVELEPSERSLYDRWVAPFARLRRAFFAVNRRATYDEMLRSVSSSTSGSAALRDYANAVGLAGFPRAKERLVSALLARHRAERTIVFTARVDDAYRIAERDLIPVITAEVSSRERARILAKFRDGRVRAMVSARVLNEGVDLPDARVAIVVSGSLGAREHVQRIGRVLRPVPHKHALIYELVTRGSMDERAARARRVGRASPGLSLVEASDGQDFGQRRLPYVESADEERGENNARD